MEADQIKILFPALDQNIRGKQLIYLDSAASALKPKMVIDRLNQYYTYETANIHRGAHYLGDLGTKNYESARLKVAQFLNAQVVSEIVFTKGTTESINLVAQTYGREFLKSGDEIILTEMEHHANLVPWLVLAKEKNLQIKYIPVLSTGELDKEAFLKLLNPKVKFLAMTHCSNTLGTINDVEFYISEAHKIGAKVLIDGAQFVVQDTVDVQELGCDFYVFSAHKLFGPYGIGVLYGKNELLEIMPPYQTGGSMIAQVDFDKVSFQVPPFKFEAGTPPISGAIGLAAAIDFIDIQGIAEIHKHEQGLLKYATEKIASLKNIKIIGEAKNKSAILSFVFSDMHMADVGQILDQEGIAVRVGHHCTQPLMKKLGITGTIRASFSVYNDKNDVDQLVSGLNKARELLV